MFITLTSALKITILKQVKNMRVRPENATLIEHSSTYGDTLNRHKIEAVTQQQ